MSISANSFSTRVSTGRLARLTGATNTRIVNVVVRGHRTPSTTSCINDNELTRVHSFYTTGRVRLIVTSNRLAPIRTEGVRGTTSTQIISHAVLVLSVFTRHTHSTRNGVRIRLTRLGCSLPQLANGKASLSELNNKVNAENPNRAGLRASGHRVEHEVRCLGRDLRGLRGHHLTVRSHERGGNTRTITVINCAGINGSALVGYLAGTNILRRGGLFTALSPATEGLALPGNRSVVLISAINLIHHLPRGLISTFRSALRRTL